MIKKCGKLVVVSVVASLLLAIGVTAATPEELAAQSAAKAKETSNVKPTPDMVKAKVNDACALLEAEGAAGLAKLQGSDSDFIFAGTYIWVNDMDCTMVMHPMKNKLNGKPLMNIKDNKGKRLFVEFVNVCNDKGEGWVDYWWPKPGEKKASQKVSYVKKATMDGKDVVVGSGIYDVPADEITVLVGQ